MLGKKTEGVVWDVEETMENRENPESQKINYEIDEL